MIEVNTHSIWQIMVDAQILVSALQALKTTVECAKIFGFLRTLFALSLFILFLVPKEQTYNQPTSKCWSRFVTKWAAKLPEAVDYSDRNDIFESYAAANLMCGKEKSSCV